MNNSERELDTLIQPHELAGWIKRHPGVERSLLAGYCEAISDMTDSVLTDPRSSRNSHILNPRFHQKPIYFMGFQPDDEQRLLIASCIYVFPPYRSAGHGRHLLNCAKQLVRDRATIQVAVEEDKVETLGALYMRYGFLTTGKLKRNFLGKGYVDYFWSVHPLRLTDVPYGTRIETCPRA